MQKLLFNIKWTEYTSDKTYEYYDDNLTTSQK